MRFVRFQWDDGPRWGLIEGDEVRLVEGDVLGAWRTSEERRPLAGLRLLPPCEPSKIVALGLNYKSHAAEMNMSIPDDLSEAYNVTDWPG